MKNKTKIGLALGSGGWRGLAHIGVIKSLLKHGFTISAVAGSSAGALIGGLYAYLQDISKVESFFNQLKYPDLLYAFSDPSTHLGFLEGTRTLKLIHRYTGEVLVENLPIPFAAVASDLLSGEPVILTSGDLGLAIRASGSVPLVFEPIFFKNKILIDGGVVNPIPVSAAKKLGADLIIGVDVYHSMFKNHLEPHRLSKIDVINLSYHLLLSKLSRYDGQAADLCVIPEIENLAYDPFSRFINNQGTIDTGEIAMDKLIPDLKTLIASLP